jgi:hypothetical protein
MESRQKTTQQLPKDTNKIKRDKEKMSLDPLWKVPKNMNRIIHQLQDDKNPEYSEIAFERKINNHEVSEVFPFFMFRWLLLLQISMIILYYHIHIPHLD